MINIFDVKINSGNDVITLDNVRIIAPELQPYYDYIITYLGDPDYESHANIGGDIKRRNK